IPFDSPFPLHINSFSPSINPLYIIFINCPLSFNTLIVTSLGSSKITLNFVSSLNGWGIFSFSFDLLMNSELDFLFQCLYFKLINNLINKMIA
ncbi:MAG: hypothetical protein WAT89_08370, partial [Candidatus Kapaibacterium sp.]